MRDPYDVLGVPRSADAAAIKSAFRQLAKKLHPDANKSDPKAAQRFAELNTAYEILGDDGQAQGIRPRRDRRRGQAALPGLRGLPRASRAAVSGRRGFRDDVSGRRLPPRRRARGGFGGFEDILKGMFGGAAAGRRTGFETHVERGRDFGAPRAAATSRCR